MEQLENQFYIVLTKQRYVKAIGETFWEGCESINEAKHFATEHEANDVVKLLADKFYVYGAKAELICSPAEKKSRKGIGGIPKGCTWVIVDGKRKLVRPGEQAPQDEPTALAKECPDREPVVKKSLTTESSLTWQDIKLIVRRADYVLEKHTKKEILEMGEEQYYKNILHDFNILKKYCSVGSQQTPLLDELFRQIEDAVKKQAK